MSRLLLSFAIIFAIILLGGLQLGAVALRSVPATFATPCVIIGDFDCDYRSSPICRTEPVRRTRRNCLFGLVTTGLHPDNLWHRRKLKDGRLGGTTAQGGYERNRCDRQTVLNRSYGTSAGIIAGSLVIAGEFPVNAAVVDAAVC